MTTFSEIYDNFLAKIQDFRLTNLYNLSVESFETFLSTWLFSAIPEFGICDQSLAYSNSAFSENLTPKNIDVLATLLKKRWLEWEVDNVAQMENFVTDRDFKMYSNSANMQAKLARYREMKEEVSQRLVDYGLRDSDMWTNWLAGVFYSS